MPERPTLKHYGDITVFFAAERTLLAWNRTSVALMGVGFVIERFGLFLRMLPNEPHHYHHASFWLGVSFILFGAAVSAASAIQYRRIVRSLPNPEIPLGYWVNLPIIASVFIALLGLTLAVYFLLADRIGG